MEIWDSADPVQMQYVQACDILGRSDNKTWYNCIDSIHTGKNRIIHFKLIDSKMIFFRLCNDGAFGSNSVKLHLQPFDFSQ